MARVTQGTPSDPGRIRVSEEKLATMIPAQGCVSKLLLGTLQLIFRAPSDVALITELLVHGDNRAAVVVSTSPLLIAAYTDEIDCVAVMKFDDDLIREYGLKIGSRLLTCNSYRLGPTLQPDLIEGPNSSGQFAVFYPIIAEFISDDTDRINQRKAEIDEQEWERAYQLGMEYLEKKPGIARPGDPTSSHIFAQPY